MNLTDRELQVLAKFLEHLYISYDNIELLILVRKIVKNADELVGKTSKPTC